MNTTSGEYNRCLALLPWILFVLSFSLSSLSSGWLIMTSCVYESQQTKCFHIYIQYRQGGKFQCTQYKSFLVFMGPTYVAGPIRVYREMILSVWNDLEWLEFISKASDGISFPYVLWEGQSRYLNILSVLLRSKKIQQVLHRQNQISFTLLEPSQCTMGFSPVTDTSC